MATYNGARFVKQQIDSILPQLSENDELIISDDGSTDETLEIISSYNDKRIKVFHHEKNPAFEKIKYSRNHYYVTNNFENALSNANGDYIFLSDQDDVWHPDKIKIMSQFLKKYDCVLCNFSIIDINGEIIRDKYYESNPIRKGFFLSVVNPCFGCCMAFSKEVLKNVLPFPRKLIAHDKWISSFSSVKFKLYFVLDTLHYYRRTGENVSNSATNGKSNNPFYFKVIYRLRMLMQLLGRLIKFSPIIRR